MLVDDCKILKEYATEFYRINETLKIDNANLEVIGMMRRYVKLVQKYRTNYSVKI